MSSASVVICKLGSIGKLARPNSLAGIKSLLKDKKDKDDTGENSRKGNKKKGGKGEAFEVSIPHVTAELQLIVRAASGARNPTDLHLLLS